MDLIGKVLANRYEILEQIGIGGMAIVYKARCNLLNRYVAIKVLKPEFAKDELFVKRFRAEAQSAASLTHPNIVSVYDVGQENGINYIVMELLESKTLKDYIDEHPVLSNEVVLKISIQIASALEAAHKAHIIHRDIKPHNIVLNKNLVAKVTDFGIAKVSTTATITNFGNTMGSVHYFSPEHAKGGYTDEKSDIYSLGVVMYEMATKKLPFDADSPVSVALKHIQEEPVPPKDINPKVSDQINKIILKCMAKSTMDRYKNATDLLDDLNMALRNPNGTKTSFSALEAGKTQVIPIITREQEEQNKVLNLRMRQPRRMSVVSSKEDIDVKENEELDDNVSVKKDKKNPKKNKKLVKIYLITAAILIVIIVSFFGVKIYNKIKRDNLANQQIQIPNLVNQKYDDVVTTYSEQGITINKVKEDYDNEIEEGYIISQTPNADTTTADKTISVVVSKGKKMVVVPDVTGQDFKVAKYQLEETLGFVIEKEEITSDTVAEGLVISQDPAKDSEAAYGSTVHVKVSIGDGKAKVIMPSVLGKTEEDAKKAITDLKLTVKVETGEDKTKDNGVVISQSYPQNQELKEGDLVTITVNKLMVSKTVTLDLLELQGGTLPEDTTKNIAVKVVGSIDGSATNTYYDKELPVTQEKATFTINGYTSATLQIYIDGVKKKEQTISFK